MDTGAKRSCGILHDDALRCWGRGSDGRLGYGNTITIGDNELPNTVGPVDLGTGRTAGAVSAGGAHTCAILDNGSVRCWGLASSVLSARQRRQQRRQQQRHGEQPAAGGSRHRADGEGDRCGWLSHVRDPRQRRREVLGLGELRTARLRQHEQPQATAAVRWVTPCRWLTSAPVACESHRRRKRPHLRDPRRRQPQVLGLGEFRSARLHGLLRKRTNRGDNAGEMGDNLPAVPVKSGTPIVTAVAAGSETRARSSKVWERSVGAQAGAAVSAMAIPPIEATIRTRWKTRFRRSTSARDESP